MKHIGRTLYNIIEEKGLVKRKIAINCGINPGYFSQLMNKESLDAELLEIICKEMEISPGYFFDDWDSEKYTFAEISNSAQNSKELTEALSTIDKLRQQLLEEKERVIKILSAKSGIEI